MGSDNPTSPVREVYLDHGATSFPKPPQVIDAMAFALEQLGGNPGRGTYRLALETARAIHRAREDAARFLGVPHAADLSFQPGCTQAMNLVLRGLLSAGDRVVVGSMEHNAVARPLNALALAGVEVLVVDADQAGVVDADAIEAAVAMAPTKAVVCQQAGNVTGAIQPVADISDIAHDHGALMIVDGAQAAGHLPIDLRTLGADAWATSGHKGMLGPQGIGLLYLAPGCEPDELVSGGTGSGHSEEPLQPRQRPERYEAGTPNTPGIVGLGAAIGYLEEHVVVMREQESALMNRLLIGLSDLGFRVLGPAIDEPRVPIASVVHPRIDADSLAHRLDRDFGIATRSGLHCAPWAHKSIGTMETGALRLGLGYGNTTDDVEYVLDALRDLVGTLS